MTFEPMELESEPAQPRRGFWRTFCYGFGHVVSFPFVVWVRPGLAGRRVVEQTVGRSVGVIVLASVLLGLATVGGMTIGVGDRERPTLDVGEPEAASDDSVLPEPQANMIAAVQAGLIEDAPPLSEILWPLLVKAGFWLLVAVLVTTSTTFLLGLVLAPIVRRRGGGLVLVGHLAGTLPLVMFAMVLVGACIVRSFLLGLGTPGWLAATTALTVAWAIAVIAVYVRSGALALGLSPDGATKAAVAAAILALPFHWLSLQLWGAVANALQPYG